MTRLLSSLLLVLLLGGCASTNTRVERRQAPEGMQRYFVLANSNDNRAIDRRIANALRAHGLTAESGPRTMMPEDTQVLVSYEDHWSWDFGDRLNYLRITFRNSTNAQPWANAEFQARIPGRPALDPLIADLVDRMVTGKK